MYVIKIGGSLDGALHHACADIQRLRQRGDPVVVVHGGSAEINRLGQQIGYPSRYLTHPSGGRSRYADPSTLDVLVMAMTGRVKPAICARLVQLDVPAVGLSGVDGALVQANKSPPFKAFINDQYRVVRDDYSGRITSIKTDLLRLLLGGGYVPVISPPVIDLQAGLLNTDADRLAATIAMALSAHTLILLSNIPGLLRDPDDPASLIPTIPQAEFSEHLELAQGRMKVKLLAAYDALSHGVARVVLGDGRVESPVFHALSGHGTTLVADSYREEIPR